MTTPEAELSLQLDTIRDCLTVAVEAAGAIAHEAFVGGEVGPQKLAQALLLTLRSMERRREAAVKMLAGE